MSKTAFTVDVTRREQLGSAACRRLRRQGHVPGVLYGMGLDPFAVTVSPRRIDEILASDTGRNTIFTLSLEEGGTAQTRAAMIRELTRDPVSSRLMHVDFVRVDLSRTVQVSVPVHLVGEAAGVKEGGILEQIHREVRVECLPANIPESLDFDVRGLAIGDQVHLRDLVIPADVEVLDDGGVVLALVAAPAAAEAPAGEAAGAAAAAAPAEGESPESES